MKINKRRFLAGFLCLAMMAGCTTQSNTTETTSKPEAEEKINTFYASETSEKEQFYLSTSNTSYEPFEVSFDKAYSLVTCKLYQLQDGAWKSLEQFDLELSGDTFWFLVTPDLTNAFISYKNVDPEPDNIVSIGGRPFEKIIPDFGDHGIMAHSKKIEEIKVEENKEIPVMADIVWKDMEKTLEADPDDFNHPEEITLGSEEAYYVLTFTFIE